MCIIMSHGKKNIGFYVPDKINDKVNEDTDQHIRKCETPVYTYSFTPTSLSTILKVDCSICNKVIATTADFAFDDDMEGFAFEDDVEG